MGAIACEYTHECIFIGPTDLPRWTRARQRRTRGRLRAGPLPRPPSLGAKVGQYVGWNKNMR
eukprot:3020372-Pyramimonas_sp.AAC.1